MYCYGRQGRTNDSQLSCHDSQVVGQTGSSDSPVAAVQRHASPAQRSLVRVIATPTTHTRAAPTATTFGDPPSTGYKTLIYDCMNGDATLCVSDKTWLRCELAKA